MKLQGGEDRLQSGSSSLSFLIPNLLRAPVAAVVTGPQAKAKGKNRQTITGPTTANLDFHVALGGLTTACIFYDGLLFHLRAENSGVKPKGAIRLHRDLEWLHRPA